jgi:hypothetical protein
MYNIAVQSVEEAFRFGAVLHQQINVFAVGQAVSPARRRVKDARACRSAVEIAGRCETGFRSVPSVISSGRGQFRPVLSRRLNVSRAVEAAMPRRRAISRVGTQAENFR